MSRADNVFSPMDFNCLRSQNIFPYSTICSATDRPLGFGCKNILPCEPDCVSPGQSGNRCARVTCFLEMPASFSPASSLATRDDTSSGVSWQRSHSLPSLSLIHPITCPVPVAQFSRVTNRPGSHELISPGGGFPSRSQWRPRILCGPDREGKRQERSRRETGGC